MSTPTRNCGSAFYSSLSLVIDIAIRNSYDYINEDHNKEYPLTKFMQFLSVVWRNFQSTFNNIFLMELHQYCMSK